MPPTTVTSYVHLGDEPPVISGVHAITVEVGPMTLVFRGRAEAERFFTAGHLALSPLAVAGEVDSEELAARAREAFRGAALNEPQDAGCVDDAAGAGGGDF